MTNREIGNWQDLKLRAKLVARLVFNDYTKPFSRETVEAAIAYNEAVIDTNIALEKLASTLNS